MSPVSPQFSLLPMAWLWSFLPPGQDHLPAQEPLPHGQKVGPASPGTVMLMLSRASLSPRDWYLGIPQLLRPDASHRSCLRPPPHGPDPRPGTRLGADFTFALCSDCPPHPTSHARWDVFPCPQWTRIWHPGPHIMVLSNGRWEEGGGAYMGWEQSGFLRDSRT